MSIQKFQSSDRVQVKGDSSAPITLWGQKGVIAGYDKINDCYHINLNSGKAILRENEIEKVKG